MTHDALPMGTLRRDGEQWVLRFERRLGHPPELVWRALTESEQLEHWMPCDIVGERKEGASIELPFWPPHVEKYGIETPTLQGRIRVWEPPSVFEWTWDTDVLRWELQPIAEGTLLVFTTWTGEDAAAATNAAAGYHVCLDNLVDLIATGRADPLIDADVAPWERQYEEAAARAS